MRRNYEALSSGQYFVEWHDYFYTSHQVVWNSAKLSDNSDLYIDGVVDYIENEYWLLGSIRTYSDLDRMGQFNLHTIRLICVCIVQSSYNIYKP